MSQNNTLISINYKTVLLLLGIIALTCGVLFITYKKGIVMYFDHAKVTALHKETIDQVNKVFALIEKDLDKNLDNMQKFIKEVESMHKELGKAMDLLIEQELKQIQVFEEDTQKELMEMKKKEVFEPTNFSGKVLKIVKNNYEELAKELKCEVYSLY